MATTTEGGAPVPLGTPERVGHTAGDHEHEKINAGIDSSSDKSGEPKLTDGSSDDESGIPGENVKYHTVRLGPVVPHSAIRASSTTQCD